MPLTTRCRRCGRMFPVSAQQLKERRGKMSCPQCGGRFDALGGLIDEAIPGAQMMRGDQGTGGSPQPAATTPADMLDLSAQRRKKGRLATALWSVVILLLIAALVVQIAWWERGTWLLQPRVHALAEAVCDRIGCRPEPPRLAGTMEILRPALTEREEYPEGLRLTLTLVNNAATAQRPPQLQVELYDLAGAFAAARRFEPEQYLRDKRQRPSLLPGEAVAALLDLEAPPTPAAGFRIKLF